MDKKTEKVIAARNDELRRRIYFPPEGDQVVLTPSVKSNPDPVLHAVRDFKDFDDDDGGRHDFGVVTVESQKYYFKIDYYNEDHTGGGDPLDENTRRVLTVMRADEY